MRRRRAAGFADPDTDPGQQQLDPALRQPTQGREQRPGRQRPRNHVATIDPIGEPAERDAGCHVEKGKRDAGEKPDLAIGQLKFGLYGLDQGRQHEAVRDVERVDQSHHAQCPRSHVAPVHPICAPRQDFSRSTKIITVEHTLAPRAGPAAVSFS